MNCGPLSLNLELVMVGERNPGKLDFEIFVSWKNFDRNLPVRFHERMAIPLNANPVR
jgi:hypothetical protein